ncbi:hypothetical protein BE17_24055 [Sorangium cellulosum]|uniref:Uncharacterized protein n=1 Tax=Sorangium cellulosum TaxID=56 RepID=A0A150RUQ0_SORCE|nr:hypothetical protein BE17_24055 [Sorangium cellulosum]
MLSGLGVRQLEDELAVLRSARGDAVERLPVLRERVAVEVVRGRGNAKGRTTGAAGISTGASVALAGASALAIEIEAAHTRDLVASRAAHETHRKE